VGFKALLGKKSEILSLNKLSKNSLNSKIKISKKFLNFSKKNYKDGAYVSEKLLHNHQFEKYQEINELLIIGLML